jgi:hypothetical protein
MYRIVTLVAAVAAVLAALAAPATAGNAVPFKGTDTGGFRFSPTSDPAVVVTEDWGAGYAAHLGRYTFTATEHVNLVTLAVTSGAYTMTAANGDTLYGTYEGQAAPTADPAAITYRVSGPILGGTGRFAGVTGFVVWDGWGNLATGDLGDSISGWISNGGSRALAAAGSAPTAPAALVGKWTRVVTQAERMRQSGFGTPAGRWTMRIERNTALTFVGPSQMLFSGNVTVTANRIHLTVGAGGPNSYVWSRSGNKLTLKLVADGTGDRRAVVIGVWTRLTR